VSTNKKDSVRSAEKAELQRILNAPSEREIAAAKLAQIEREEAEEREQEGRKAAADRCKAISRALGSLATQFEEDELALLQHAAAYGEAVERINNRYAQIQLLAAESDALTDRFRGVAPAKVPEIIPPDRREVVITAARAVEGMTYSNGAPILPATETCEHELRRRRSYEEVRSTPAFEIISRAGIPRFPELNERQRFIVAERKRESAQDDKNRTEIGKMAAQAPALASGRHPLAKAPTHFGV
jgi:hypothetical protein